MTILTIASSKGGPGKTTLLDQTQYAAEWERKQAWYQRWFPGRLVVTIEGPKLSRDAERLINALLTGDIDVLRSFARYPELATK